MDICENSLKLKTKVGRHVEISALKKEGFDQLAEMMIQAVASLRKTITVRIPQSHYDLVTLLHREGNVHFENYEENDVVMMVDVPHTLIYRFEEFVTEESRPAK